MAMTKAEKAAMEAALTAAALRSTSPVLPDVPAPKPGTLDGGHTTGWKFHVRIGDSFFRGFSVEEAWSDSQAHGTGPYRTRGVRTSGSQGAVNLFSTKLLALRAARHEAEQQAARALRAIDRAIEEELASQAKGE